MVDNNQSSCLFNTDPPSLSESEIRDLLSRQFAVSDAELVPLVSERDQNYLVVTPHRKCVLKIFNTAENPRVIDAQTQALKHLHKTGFKNSVPNLIDDSCGDPVYLHQTTGGIHCVRLLSYLPGELYSTFNRPPCSLVIVGEFLGRLSQALSGFGHSGAHRENFLWNLDNVFACRSYLGHVEDGDNRQMLSELLQRYETLVLPRLHGCRGAVIHNDVNDNNIIVFTGRQKPDFGLIDFGDLCYGRQINELAVAMAYLLQGEKNLYTASRQIVSGYHKHFPLHENELEILFDLIRMRLLMSVCISSMRSKSYAENDYLRISQKPAFELLWRMQAINPQFITAMLRDAANFAAVRQHEQIVNWLKSPRLKAFSMFKPDLKTSSRRVLKLDAAVNMSPVVDFQDLLTDEDIKHNTAYLIGLYGEDRDVYQAPQFASAPTPERRTVHLGVDIFIEANTAIYSPLPGRVFSLADNDLPLDYGPTLILEHDAGQSGCVFYTLYGHLSDSVFDLLDEGRNVDEGQLLGHVGEFSENGGWAPHLHFQIMTTMLGLSGNFNGVGEKSLWPVWRQICPDPNLIMQLAPESFLCSQSISSLIEKRRRLLGPSLSLSYQSKLNIVRGSGAYLFDHTGRQFLDCVNNICHVGHCHPRVVDALEGQARLLNTNTRYLHRHILDYSERLTRYLPAPLSVVYFVNSGTEANELALRIARTATGVKETIVLDWAYHGNSTATVEISPYKFKRKGGFTKPEYVEIADLPDPFRGRVKGMSVQSGHAYAKSVSDCIEAIVVRTGHGPAAFIAESISGVGGQVVYPQGYLEAAYRAVRSAGGLCIADEVQCGFGRVGTHFWAFELQDVVPDIVVMGKPMGNGHPLAAVVTTAQLAAEFSNGMEYFNSFGGNPVSMAVGMAVLDVIEEQELVPNAKIVGNYLLNRFNELKNKFNKIGDVRGHGLFLGIELVQSMAGREPATELARDIVNDLRENAVLFSTDGPGENVLKFKPPMVFSMDDADYLIGKLEASLSKFHGVGDK